MSMSASTENSDCVKCGNGAAQIDNYCRKCDEKVFISTMKTLINKGNVNTSAEKRTRVYNVFTYMNKKPYWKSYKRLKSIAIRKSYQFIGEIKALQIPSSERLDE